MELYSIIISAFVTIFASGLLIVSLASYRKYSHLKLLFVSLVFLVLLIKGVLLSLSVFFDELQPLFSTSFTGLFDLLILLFLFVATLKR